ncbi:hypothetical protein GF312_21640 [Candidatus Poribacteria bacterium]|nr:hypothetical protein [Candidatus Poribacteria bacterium]
MRIGVTSDIHTDISPGNSQIIKHIAEAVKEAELDVFIICGDISANVMVFSRTLGAFHHIDSDCKKLLVAGNHDIWTSQTTGKIDSNDKYKLITAIASEHDFHHLGDSPVIIDKIGFCGTIGWYDYSYRNDKHNIPIKYYMKKFFQGSVWNDVNYAKWGKSDIEMARYFENELQNQINSIKNGVSRIIAVTHHVPFKECVKYKDKLPWDFFSAFMGSVGLGEICLKEPLITHALFGHTHANFNVNIKGVQAVCSPVGYLTDPPKSLSQYARQKLHIIDIA